MWTHDEEHANQAKLRRTEESEGDTAGDLAARALADNRTGPLSQRAVTHLQRTAGNASVASFVAQRDVDDAPESGRSPVLDVVGRGGGQPLPKDTREEMEARLGHDFQDVRVHTGSDAASSAKSVQAHAYTVGNDMVFQDGVYDPSSDAGKRTLAHELTHVAQQRQGPVDGTDTGGGVKVSSPNDRFERDAEASADRAMSSNAPAVAGGDSSGRGHAAVQREGAAKADEEHEELQTLAVQRQDELPEEEVKKKKEEKPAGEMPEEEEKKEEKPA